MLGFEVSRADDLESLFYATMPRIPWLKVHGVKEVIDLKNFQDESYFRYLRQVGFTQRPDYKTLQDILTVKLKEKVKKPENLEFDWQLAVKNELKTLFENEGHLRTTNEQVKKNRDRTFEILAKKADVSAMS
jgi:hypothetical protein